MSAHYDVVIIGGGVMGAATAFWLTRLSAGTRVLVVERDPSYAQAATALSVASIRMQFSTEVNIKISRFGIDFIKNFADRTGPEGGVGSLGFQENGYLVLAQSGQGAQHLREMAELQNANGAATLIWDAEALVRHFPWIDPVGVQLASFGSRDEGWFDNMGLLSGMRSAARAAGAEFLRDRAIGLQRQGSRLTGVLLEGRGAVSCGTIVNAAGTRGTEVAAWAGVVLPVEPRKRTVFVIDAPNARHRGAPLLIDKGFYLRPEHEHWITATVPEDDSSCDVNDFDPDLHLFEDVIWEQLYTRAPGFDAVKVVRHWVGHYDYNTFDQNALVGTMPGLENFHFLNGFSGHGLQQSPALGRGTAEMILHGSWQSLDLSDLSIRRLAEARPVVETAII